MGKSNVRKVEFDLGDYSETYERGRVTDLCEDLGDYSLKFNNNSTFTYYKGSRRKKVIDIDDLNTSSHNKRIIKNAISSMRDDMGSYNYWFSFSRDTDVSFDGDEFSISSSVEVYCATGYNSRGYANYKSTTFSRSMSIDIDEIKRCTEPVLAAAALVALIMCDVATGGAATPFELGAVASALATLKLAFA